MERDPREIVRRREELQREAGAHPSPEALARLLAGALEAEEAKACLDHLAGCRRCFGLYAELAQLEPPDRLDALSPSWRDAAVGAAAPAGERSVQAPRPKAFSSRRRNWLVGAGLAASAVILGIFLTRSPDGDSPRELRADARLLDPVQRALGIASQNGMILTTDIAVSEAPMRGGAEAGSPGLRRALSELAALYEQPAAGEEVAFWLIAGMLAEGDPSARAILGEALERHPRSRRIRNLDAVLAYREGRTEVASAILRDLLRADSQDPIALFNLYLLAKETGAVSERKSLLAALDRTLPREAPLRSRLP